MTDQPNPKKPATVAGHTVWEDLYKAVYEECHETAIEWPAFDILLIRTNELIKSQRIKIKSLNREIERLTLILEGAEE